MWCIASVEGMRIEKRSVGLRSVGYMMRVDDDTAGDSDRGRS